MADSIYAEQVPGSFDLYAGYIDGHWPSYEPMVARFGPGKVVPIAVFSSTNAGIVGDCENGDMTPQTAVEWVHNRRAAGADPTIYCSLSNWTVVQQTFTAHGVDQPHYWIAAYPGNGPNLYPGAIAHQYADMGPYDVSVVADFWPGFDIPVPTPPPAGPTHYQEDNVTSYPVTVRISQGRGWVPSPAPAASVFSVAILTENPEVVGRYDTVPTIWSIATQPGKNSPNGAVVIEGLVADGNYGAVIWAAG